MRADIACAIAGAGAAHDISIDELLETFELVTDGKAGIALRQSIAFQLIRAVEVACLTDPVILDVALNPTLYLGRELSVLEFRLGELFGGPVPDALVGHVRMLAMSRAAGSRTKAAVATHDEDVFRRAVARAKTLRCSDCGYQFTALDLGERRQELAAKVGLQLAPVQLARRLRDSWKPASRSKLTLDHIVPEAGLGPTDPDNLRVACEFCNQQKQIYRWPGETVARGTAAALLGLGFPDRGSWAVWAATYAAMAEAGRCATCSRSAESVELTARTKTDGRRDVTPPWKMYAVCYECFDPSGPES